MLSKGEMVFRSSLWRSTLAIFMLGASVAWVPADSLAQEAASGTPEIMARATSWSFGRLRPTTGPNLMIGMDDRKSQTVNISDQATISQPIDTIDSVNRPENANSSPIVLARFFAPSSSVANIPNLQNESTNERDAINGLPGLARANAYSLLDDELTSGSLAYRYQMKDFHPEQWLTGSESFSLERENLPHPLFEIAIGDWHLPIVLSRAAGSK